MFVTFFLKKTPSRAQGPNGNFWGGVDTKTGVEIKLKWNYYFWVTAQSNQKQPALFRTQNLGM